MDEEGRILDEIYERIDILQRLQGEIPEGEEEPEVPPAPMYAEFVYEIPVSEKNPNGGSMYLPEDVIGYLVNLYLAGKSKIVTNFRDVWDYIISSYGVVTRVTDGTPIEILDVAIVWLNAGLKAQPDKVFPPFNVFTKGLTAEDRQKFLHKILVKHIDRTLEDVHDVSEAFYIQKDLITSAENLDSIIEYGIAQQAQTLKALNLIEEEYIGKKLPVLDAFDDELDQISYSLFLSKTSGERVEHTESFEKELFDLGMKVGPLVPVCIANLDEVKIPKNMFKSVDQRWFKVWLPDFANLETYHANGWTSEAEARTIVFFVFAGDNEEDAKKLRRKDFVPVTYSFRKGSENYGTLQIVLDHRGVDVIASRLNKHLVGYKVSTKKGEMKEPSIVQSFLIPGMQFDTSVLMNMIASDITASTLLRINEVEKPMSLKKIVKFNVFLLGRITILLKSEEVKTFTRPVRTKDVLHALIKGDKIVTVQISAQNPTQYEMSRFFILKVLGKYVQEYDRIVKLYRNFFGKTLPNLPPLTKLGKLAEESGEMKNIKLLRYADPGVWWNAGYARPVAPKIELQVKPIKESEIETYRAMGRDVIRWPVKVTMQPDGKVYDIKPSIDPYTRKPLIVYYTTTTDQKPRITLVKNPGPNKTTHPLIPKCQASDTTLFIDDDTWEITIFSTEKEKTVKGDLSTLKILGPARNGTVQGSIAQYLGVKSMLRLGMFDSKSSFLRCVMVSQNVDEFREIHDTPESEAVVLDIRRLLPPLAAVCKQENPNMSIEEIARELGDPNVFLDPLRHYRAVEELLNVNIFVATPNSNKELVLAAPTCSGSCSRSKRNYERDSIVIIKLQKKTSKKTAEYQCELLGVNEGGSMYFAFGENATIALEKAVDSLTRTITIQPSCKIVQVEDGWAARQSISADISTDSKLSIPTTLVDSIIKQKIDSLGKLRAFKVKLSAKDSFWCIVPPLEPLAKGPELVPLGEIENTSRKTLEKVLEKYGKTSLKYTPCEEMLVGVWVLLEGLYVFIPLEPSGWNTSYTPVRFDYPYLPKAPMAIKEESYTENYNRLRRVMALMIQILKRLYVSSGLNVEEFSKQHMVINENAPKMIIPKISHLIPTLRFEELKAYFNKILPTFFHEGKLLCDSQRLYDNLVSRLRTFQKVIDAEAASSKNLEGVQGNVSRVTGFPPCFEEFYVTLDDFKVHPGTDQTIFMSMNRYLLEMKMHAESTPTVVRKITVSLLRYKNPVFYMYEDAKISALYLIQNVHEGDASRAATLAQYWRQNKVNLGYHCPDLVGSDAVTNLKADNMVIEDPHAPMIVFYGTGEAAALLSLNSEEN